MKNNSYIKPLSPLFIPNLHLLHINIVSYVEAAFDFYLTPAIPKRQEKSQNSKRNQPIIIIKSLQKVIDSPGSTTYYPGM